MSNEDLKLKQVILVRTDVDQGVLMQKSVAKASLLLVTRCFESSKDFLGRHEVKDYQQTVMDWIDACDSEIEIVQVEGELDMDAYEWTAEMLGIPTQRVVQKDQVFCMAVGSYDADKIDQFLDA